jgi:hypothetical protein
MAYMQIAAQEPDASPRPATPETSQGGLDRFRACVLAETSLQKELAALDSSDELAAHAAEAARRRGISLDARTIEAAMDARNSAGNAGGGDVPPAGWLPAGTSWRNGALTVRWSYFGEERLRAPFFAMDAQPSLGKPFNRLVRPTTAIDRVHEHLSQHPPLRPSGLIFHMSRCGSTLVAQMLAACADNVVISEASPIDDVVRARQIRPDLSEDQQARWLAGIVGALGQPRAGESRLFVKLDCWHTLALPLFRRAFPDVPWVFLYRDPVEVMVSQRRMPGMQMIPGAFGPELLGIAPTHDRPDDYCARVLARICEPIVRQHAQGGGLLVNYRDLPQALWTMILPHFGVVASAAERAAMAETAKYDAKMPGFEFTPDSEARQRAASAATRAAASERLGDIYGRLEALRLGA